MEILRTEKLFIVEEQFLTEEGKKQNGFLKAKRLYLKNKGVEYTRDKLDSSDAVCGVVYDERLHKYIFVKQWRPGPEKFVIELAAGLLDHKLIPIETMILEVEQELGYKVDKIVEICTPSFTTPGKTGEKMYFYYITVSEQISEGGGEESENEDIEVIKVYQSEIKGLGIEDMKTLFALYKLGIIVE